MSRLCQSVPFLCLVRCELPLIVKPILAEYILVYATCALMMAGVFYRPLALPEHSDIVLILAALVCFGFYRRSQRRRKHTGKEPSIGRSHALQGTWTNKSGRLWIIIAIFAAVSLIFPFVAPYTIPTLSTEQAVISSVITFVVGVALSIFTSRRRDENI